MNMVHNLTVKDELLGTGLSNEFMLWFEEPRVSVADIIRERVRHEVENYNARTAEYNFIGLVQPTESEIELNGYKLKKGRQVDATKQIEVALREFESCAYFILVDDLQVKSLDDEVALSADTKVTFIKLTPLVGG